MRLPEDKAHPVEPIVIRNAILRPFRAMTYLASLVEPPKRPDAPKVPPAVWVIVPEELNLSRVDASSGPNTRLRLTSNRLTLWDRPL